MRAAHLVTRLNVGGIARYLQTARDAVDVLLLGRVEPGEAEAEWPGPQVRVPGLRRSVRPPDDARALASLLHALRRRRPRVLHTHASKAGALGRIAARILKIPCVHTFHGHVMEGYFPRPISWLILRTERFLARHATITATGPATARQLTRRLNVPVRVVAPGIELAPPAVDARERLRDSWGRPERVALAVARQAAVKDLARFVSASRAAGYLPVVAGSVQVPGALALGTVDAMQDVYEACDVVVSASRQEGTPFALLEAAWCGRPVVAPPVGDVAWIVGEGGIVGEDLAAGLRAFRDPGLRDEIGRRAAADVRARFPASAVAPRLRELYESLH